MDRERLVAYLAEGLSLIEIGALEDRDPSTVGYWVKKHGLVANGKDLHAARGAIDAEVLTALVAEGLPLREIAEARRPQHPWRDHVRHREQRPGPLPEMSYGRGLTMASPHQGEARCRGWWLLCRLRIREASRSASLPPSGPSEEGVPSR